MTDQLSLIAHHGYVVVCLVVFAEAIGVPVPGAVALIAGGAAAASGVLYGPAVVIFATVAMVSADSLLYILGSKAGWTILKFLCRISVDPESCDFLVKILNGLSAATHAVELVIAVAVLGFISHRCWLFWKHRADRVVPRIQVAELAAKLQSEGPGKVLLADVRSHGYYAAGAVRIPGSIRIEPNNLTTEMKTFPPDKDIYLYCTCPGEATSASVAHLLRNRGFEAFVVVGGLAAWRKAGNPLETVPPTDVVHLPTFSRSRLAS